MICRTNLKFFFIPSFMFNKVIDKLEKIREDIEIEMQKEITEERVGRISAKLAYFSNFLINNEQLFISGDSEENKAKRSQYNQYKLAISNYKKKIAEINLLRNAQVETQDNIEEFHENTAVVEPEDRFLGNNTRRVNSYIMNAIDTLESLKKQRVYIDNTRERIKDGLVRIGVSKGMVDKIGNRFLTDYYFFLAGVALIVVIIIIIKFFV